MKPLLVKELHGVLPYQLAILVLTVGSLVVRMLAHGADAGLSEELASTMTGWLVFGGPICFAAGLYGASREFADGTIELLDALPTSRWRIQLAKTIGGIAVLVGVLVGTALECTAIWVMYATPSAPAFGPALWTHLALLVVALFTFLAAGMALAWAGELAWVVVGVVAIGLETAAQMTPSATAITPTKYVELAYEGSTAQIVEWAPKLWLFCAALGVLGSTIWIVRARGAFGLSTAEKIYRGVLITIGILVLLTALGAGLGHVGHVTTLLLAEHQIEHSGTFTFMSQADADTSALRDRVRRVDPAVRGLLDVETPLELDVEWLAVGAFHAGEQWGRKLRISPNIDDTDVLPHELAHAYFTDLVGDSRELNQPAWDFFNEGLATWIAAQVDGPRTIPPLEHAAGYARALDQHAFDLLIRPGERRERFDSHQVYPLGLVFVQALVEEAGTKAPACLLREMAKVDESLDPNVFWFVITNGCDVDLEQVITRFETRLDSLAPASRPEMPTARLLTSGDRLLVHVEGAAGRKRLCRFRAKLEATDADLDQHDVVSSICIVPDGMKGPHGVWVQVGVVLDDEQLVFGEWAELPFPSVP